MISKILTISLISTFLFIITTNGNDEDEMFYNANNNNNFFYNDLNTCQPNHILDVDYFKCRLCDPNFNLAANLQQNKCECDRNSTELYEYDTVLKRPICDGRKPAKPKNECQLRFVDIVSESSAIGRQRSIRVYRGAVREKCTCDPSRYEQYDDKYCIRNDLIKDLKTYQNTKNNSELKFIAFICQVLHHRDYCNFLANLCVLTNYNLDKNGPCFPFYEQQTLENQFMTSDYGSKIKPFIFFKNGRSARNLVEKTIDFSYGVNDENSTVNFTIVNYNLNGSHFEMRNFHLADLNLCNRFNWPSSLKKSFRDEVKFGKNFEARCVLNLRRFIDIEPDTKFSSLHLRFRNSHATFLQTVPVLIHNAFEVNEKKRQNGRDDVERWQLVKRFYLIDTISGRRKGNNNNIVGGDNEQLNLNSISYAKSIEMRIQINDDYENTNEVNKISIPLLLIEYETIDMTNLSESDGGKSSSKLLNADFTFSIKFVKRPDVAFFFQIILPILILLAFANSLMQTIFYRIREQKSEFDCSICANFAITLLSNLSNVLALFALSLSCYVFLIYKTQTSVIEMILPLNREQNIIGILLAVALTFKIIKLLKIFYEMVTLDIFFIDFERPKYNTVGDHFTTFNGSNKSHPGTPSISSSVMKPPTSPANYECVSAWRNYFIANEWQELIAKRKISIHLHIISVITFLKIFGFENLASLEFSMHLNQSEMQNYMSGYINNEGNDSNDSSSGGSQANDCDIILKLASCTILYFVLYIAQRLANFLIYERFVDNCMEQFIDVTSIANISVLILINSFGYYIHGRSVHGRSDVDTFNMMLQFKREEENLCGHRGLLPGCDQQTYTILVPKNLRLFYERLISPIAIVSSRTSYQSHHQTMKSTDQNFEKMILTYHNINRFLAAFIDHALKDVDYVVKEKTIIEKSLDCEINPNVNETRGVFYFDNGHSFDRTLLYGNETDIFIFEIILFMLLLITTDNIFIAIISIGIVFEIIKLTINQLTKNNLARKTLIDKRFLI